tara:strand:- start:161 stop:265 length:105 start_codon:yes stop_codon:yes gene_type:complete
MKIRPRTQILLIAVMMAIAYVIFLLEFWYVGATR